MLFKFSYKLGADVPDACGHVEVHWVYSSPSNLKNKIRSPLQLHNKTKASQSSEDKSLLEWMKVWPLTLMDSPSTFNRFKFWIESIRVSACLPVNSININLNSHQLTSKFSSPFDWGFIEEFFKHWIIFSKKYHFFLFWLWVVCLRSKNFTLCFNV